MRHLKRMLLSALALLAATLAYAQTEITGIVVDESGEALVRAMVREKGTNNGALTDMQGQFTLKVKEGTLLTISYLGYVSQDLPARPGMQVVLKEDTQNLGEVVVTGYTTQRKADLTGAVAVVTTDDLKNTAEPDPMRALQGKVTGMNVAVNGSPSGAGTVRIRGIGSINTSQDPLYIVDGVPTTGALNSLNSNDIESIQVLKDAASASIYGSRAANGVIIITTKKGKKNEKVNVDFSANITSQFYTSQSKMKLLNTQQYATAMAQAALNDGLDPVAYASNYGLNLNAASGTPIRVWNPMLKQYVQYTVNGRYDGFINARRTMPFSDTDWVDAISQRGIAQNYNIAVSKATEQGSAMFSLAYKKNEGIIKYTNFENIAARMNTAFHLNKYVTVGENFTLTYTEQVDIAPMENALKMAPTVPLYEIDGRTFAGPVGGMSDRQNPLREAYDNRDNHLDFWRMFGNAYIDIKPIEGMTFRSNFGLDATSSFINGMTKTYTSDIVNNNIAKTELGHSTNVNYTWSNTLNYAFQLQERHHLNLLVGTEINKQSLVDFSAYSEGYSLEDKDYMWPNAATGTMRNKGAKVGYRLASFFGKLDYNYDDLLLASITMRRDGSSRFGSNHRWGTFPAASLGFRLSQLLKHEAINDLKLRASWGKTGNQAIDNNAQFGLYVVDYGDDRVTSTAYDLYHQGSGTFPSGYRAVQSPNPNLKWETATQSNLGLDFMLFGNAFYGSIDAFVKNVDDMLINPSYLAVMGEGGASWSNGPSLRNWGMEFSLGYRKTLSNGLGIDASANIDFFRNRVTSLPAATIGSYAHTTTENLVQSKQPFGSIVGYVADGIFQTQEEVNASGQANARVGGLKYRDLDGKNGITADDQTWIYNPVPAFSYSLRLGLTYRQFDFSMFWQGVYDKDVYNNQKFQTDFWSITDAGSNKGSRLLQAWTTDNTSSSIPALTTNNTADEGRASTYFVENGSYLKLRTLQLGYRLNDSWLERLKLSQARIYISGQNLLTLKSSGLTCSDPENPEWNYPLSASFSIGVQLSF